MVDDSVNCESISLHKQRHIYTYLPCSHGHFQVASSVDDVVCCVIVGASCGKTSWKWVHRITFLPPVSKLCLGNQWTTMINVILNQLIV